MKVHLLAIDFQKDFCDVGVPLYVNGAEKDAERVAKMIDRIGHKIDDIHATLDSHHILQVFHPLFWKDQNNNSPNPYTTISNQDVKDGTWIPCIPSWTQRMLDYTESIETNGRYVLCIWPEHCLIGSPGHAFQDDIAKAFFDWERKYTAMVDKVTKGSNMWTEHYSAVRADVIDPSDETTDLNSGLIDVLQEADLVLVTGEALSHCVANTVRDIATEFGEDNVRKLCLLEDSSSNVGGYEQLGEDFVNDMIKLGMQISTTDKILA